MSVVRVPTIRCRPLRPDEDSVRIESLPLFRPALGVVHETGISCSPSPAKLQGLGAVAGASAANGRVERTGQPLIAPLVAATLLPLADPMRAGGSPMGAAEQSCGRRLPGPACHRGIAACRSPIPLPFGGCSDRHAGSSNRSEGLDAAMVAKSSGFCQHTTPALGGALDHTPRAARDKN